MTIVTSDTLRVVICGNSGAPGYWCLILNQDDVEYTRIMVPNYAIASAWKSGAEAMIRAMREAK